VLDLCTKRIQRYQSPNFDTKVLRYAPGVSLGYIGVLLLALLVGIVMDNTDLPVGKVRRRQAGIMREEALPERAETDPQR